MVKRSLNMLRHCASGSATGRFLARLRPNPLFFARRPQSEHGPNYSRCSSIIREYDPRVRFDFSHALRGHTVCYSTSTAGNDKMSLSMKRARRVRMPAHGALQRLPYIYSSKELLELRLWKRKVYEKFAIKNRLKRERNAACRQISLVAQAVITTIRQQVKQFPGVDTIHPFDKAIIELTLSENEYQRNLSSVANLLKALSRVEKQYVEKAAQADNSEEIKLLVEEAIEMLRDCVTTEYSPMEKVRAMTMTLRSLPVFDLDRPIIALVGAPNVGKSSLVRILSSGKPEVANYPFTTRGLSVGHIFVDGKAYQIGDTPGLLTRPDAQRNKIERLALAILRHTDCGIIFVTDLSGHCGSDILTQTKLRDELRSTFPSKARTRWFDVLSKCDLQSEEQLDALKRRMGGRVYVVSTETEAGVNELKSDLIQYLLYRESKDVPAGLQ